MPALVSELGSSGAFAKYSTATPRSHEDRNQAAETVYHFGPFHQTWNVIQHIGAQETERDQSHFLVT